MANNKNKKKILFAAFEATPFSKTGGLGDVAIRYGYQRFETTIMIESVVIIIVIVALIQFMGTKIANRMPTSLLNTKVAHVKQTKQVQ